MIFKRLFDMLAAGMGVLFFAPLLACIAVAIRLDSDGPIIFRQERVGVSGRKFWIHKFRTMVPDAPSRGPPLTAGADPRITRVGAFLRRYKLDELPQLLDVLLGRMSLVGPRPEVPRYVAHYPPEVYQKVLSVRPGLTDLASLEYIDESALLAAATDPERVYLEQVMPRKLELAMRYIEERTFWLDLRIIALTLLRIGGRRTAGALKS